MTEIHERITTIVHFGQNRIVPEKFFWRERVYPVSSVNFVHSVLSGKEKIYLFSVTSGLNFYVLAYYAVSLRWELYQSLND